MTLKCTMILGDCLEVMGKGSLPSFDLTFCDPPYGVLSLPWDQRINATALWRGIKNTSRTTAVQCFTSSMKYAISLIQENEASFSYELIWTKGRGTGAFHANKRPMRAHEIILVFGRPTSTYNPQMRPAERNRRGQINKPAYPTSAFGPIKSAPYVYTDTVYPLSWLRYEPKHARRKFHPSEKPSDLISWLVRTYSNPGEQVLDPTSGSGTTAVAALSCGRNVTCIERDEGYFNASVERVRKHVRDNWIRAEIEVRR